MTLLNSLSRKELKVIKQMLIKKRKEFNRIKLQEIYFKCEGDGDSKYRAIINVILIRQV